MLAELALALPSLGGGGWEGGTSMLPSSLSAAQGQQSRNGSLLHAGGTGLPLPRLVVISLAAELKYSLPSIFPQGRGHQRTYVSAK